MGDYFYTGSSSFQWQDAARHGKYENTRQGDDGDGEWMREHETRVLRPATPTLQHMYAREITGEIEEASSRCTVERDACSATRVNFSRTP